MVRRGEIAVHVELALDFAIAVKLGAIVEGAIEVMSRTEPHTPFCVVDDTLNLDRVVVFTLTRPVQPDHLLDVAKLLSAVNQVLASNTSRAASNDGPILEADYVLTLAPVFAGKVTVVAFVQAALNDIQAVRIRIMRTPDGDPELRQAALTSLKSKSVLVLALATQCDYCDQSAPFHKLLVNEARKRGISTIAVFPEFENPNSVDEILHKHGIEVDSVYRVNLDNWRLRGTPTLYLTNSAGEVSNMREGLLSSSNADAVFFKTTGSLLSDVANKELDGSYLLDLGALSDLKKRGEDFNILDVRSREDFRKGHLVNAVNIPSDEIEVRLKHEMDLRKPVYVFCEYDSQCEFDAARLGANTFCGSVSKLIQLQGAANIKSIAETPESLMKKNSELFVRSQ